MIKKLSFTGKLMAAYVLLQPPFFYVTTTLAVVLLEKNKLVDRMTLRLVFVLFPLVQIGIWVLLDHIASEGDHSFLTPWILFGSFILILMSPAWIGGGVSFLISGSYYTALAAYVVNLEP